ncbi:MAG: ThuA domain-containing protein [Planctomycetes bacterium]|nr:ThuA domain-containing protein [Planctomycetota bacterium]
MRSILFPLALLAALAAAGLAATVAGADPSEADRARIEAALPAEAPARPSKPRRLLVFDLNVGYPGHASIAHANLAFALLGKKTGAFEAVVSRDPAVFERKSLAGFDAVFLNNTVGNLFEDPALRRSLADFVYAGGGLLGVHGTSVAFTRWPGAHEDWPEFGRMLGARGARHRASDERVAIRLDDPAHPLLQPFAGKGFEYRDELFRVDAPYSRDRVRVLLSIDVERTKAIQGAAWGDPMRPDEDYALAWVKGYGRGRVFYSTIGHNPHVFSDPLMLRFYLGAIQFALGDLPAPLEPSARLTPALRAQERLGWRLAMTAYSLHKYTLFEAIEKTAELRLSSLEGLSFQKVSKEIPKDLDPALSDDEVAQVRRKLDESGVRMVTYYYHQIPGDEAGCRRVFDFGRKLGIEAFLSEPAPEALGTIDRLCGEYGIRVAIHNHDAKGSPVYWRPEGVLKACEGRSRWIGACGDLGYWMRSGIDPIEAVRSLKDRLISLQVHDLHELSPQGHDVPWGTGAARLDGFFAEVRRLGLAPICFGLEFSYDWLDSMPEMAACRDFFERQAVGAP